MEEESTCVGHEPCPKCGSSDNLARYDDGHAHCFGMGCDHWEPATEGSKAKPLTTGGPVPGAAKTFLVDNWEPAELSKRGINLKTCQKWKYGVGTLKGKKVHVANYIDGGRIVAQKIRFANKDMLTLGDFKSAGLYGKHLWRDGGKKIVITEGEIDALSVSQLFGNKWPVVSLPNGAQGAAKAIKKDLEYLLKYNEVIFMFDNDEAGRLATEECVGLLPPGRAKVAEFELKDANEMLVAGRGSEVVDAFWSAKTYRPDGIIGIGDVRDACLTPIEEGTPWPWKGLTEATHGRRDGELYGIGAGTGIGKTDFVTQIIEHDAIKLDIPCGVVYLEQHPVETVRRIAGKHSGKKFHMPGDEDWTTEDLSNAITDLENSGNIHLYNHFGSMDWPTVEQKIRYMVVGLGCKHIFLDHLTALAAHAEDERKELETIMAEMAGMAQELQFKFHYISHLATPDGTPHEEGVRVMLRHFKGSRAIGFWSHFAIGLSRNQQAEDMTERLTTEVRVLKDRYTGAATGYTMDLLYDADTGMLNEVPRANKAPASAGFKDESSYADSPQGDF